MNTVGNAIEENASNPALLPASTSRFHGRLQLQRPAGRRALHAEIDPLRPRLIRALIILGIILGATVVVDALRPVPDTTSPPLTSPLSGSFSGPLLHTAPPGEVVAARDDATQAALR